MDKTLQTHILIATLVNLVLCGESPNGVDILARLTPDIKKNIPHTVLEDMALDTMGMVQKYGYPIEENSVLTEDGYILELYRIPKPNGIPVLLMHGLFGSSIDWVMNTPLSLAYLLHDAGYDVWMGNARGNFYSRSHSTLDPSEHAFWDFSWHEIGHYDLPAMIDHILMENGQKKLHYIGHSQGTTCFYVMASTRPEYNKKIISMNALAPSSYLTHTTNKFLLYLGPFFNSLGNIYGLIGTGELPSSIGIRNQLVAMYCHDKSSKFHMCMEILYGDKYEHVNTSMILIYLSQNPAGASLKQVTHYSQVYMSRDFAHFDYGPMENLIKYNKTTPPMYDLKKIVAPVALHYSDNDEMMNTEDVKRLHSELGNSIGMYKVPRPSFNHIDYVISTDCKQQVLDSVMKIMKSYE